MIHQLNMQGKDKVQVAIDRLKTFEPPEGYYLAFSGGKDSVVIKALADMAGNKDGLILNNDNDDGRKMVEQCYKLSKTVVNPIIDWTDGDVWEFIQEYEVPYCKLYDEGYKRLGCIGCPMATNRVEELEKYPKYKRAYIRAFERMIKNGRKEYVGWRTGQDVYDWWIGGKHG